VAAAGIVEPQVREDVRPPLEGRRVIEQERSVEPRVPLKFSRDDDRTRFGVSDAHESDRRAGDERSRSATRANDVRERRERGTLVAIPTACEPTLDASAQRTGRDRQDRAYVRVALEQIEQRSLEIRLREELRRVICGKRRRSQRRSR
jgi:hypothetical protein